MESEVDQLDAWLVMELAADRITLGLRETVLARLQRPEFTSDRVGTKTERLAELKYRIRRCLVKSLGATDLLLAIWSLAPPGSGPVRRVAAQLQAIQTSLNSLLETLTDTEKLAAKPEVSVLNEAYSRAAVELTRVISSVETVRNMATDTIRQRGSKFNWKSLGIDVGLTAVGALFGVLSRHCFQQSGNPNVDNHFYLIWGILTAIFAAGAAGKPIRDLFDVLPLRRRRTQSE